MLQANPGTISLILARIRTTFAYFASAFVLLLAILFFSPLVPALNDWLTYNWQDPKGDTLIVLGADQLGDGTLGIASYWRSVYAVSAFRAGGIQRIVVSAGPQGYPQAPALADAMADFMVGMGLPRSAITLERRSESTRENALYTCELIRNWPGTKVLLTSDCHMRRAHAAFQRAGLDCIPAPIPDIGKRWNTWLDRWECTWTVAQEFVKLGYYKIRGWT